MRWSRPSRRDALCRPMRRCWSCRTCSTGLRDLARAARARAQAKIIARHRLGRQDQHQGGAAARARRSDGETHASAASYNNHWGVPLTLARCPRPRTTRVFEIGMNHARRNHAADASWCGRTWRSSPRSSRCISNSSIRSRRSPRPRPRYSPGSSPAARPSSIATIRNFERLAARARDGGCRAHRLVRRAARRRTRGSIKIALQPGVLDRARRGFSAPRSPTSSARRAAMWCAISWPCWRRLRVCRR